MAIQIKGSHIPKVAPGAGELEERELAVNTIDGKLYTKTPSGVIIEIGADNINTGLETPTSTGGVHSGHRYINATDIVDFLPLGIDATDLSYSSGIGSIGAHGTGSFTAGIDATAKGINSVSIGKGAYVEGDNSFSIGNSINTTKNLSINIGNSSTIGGSVGTIGSFSLGSSNNIVGDGSVALGYNNNIPYNQSILIGSDNESFLSKSYALGLSLKTNNVEGGVVLGKFNNVINDKNFIIGSGTTDSDRSNSLELDANTGVLKLPKLNSVGNIQSNYDVITLGYLESYSNIVRTVNGYAGNVSLTAADIPEQVGVDKHWLLQAERDQIVANTNAIPTKEPLLPSAGDVNKVLTVTDPLNRIWEWKTLEATSVSIHIGDLLDVDQFDSTDANKYLKVNGAGTVVGYEFMTRTELQLRNVGGSSTDPVSGLTFELADDPYYWGVNNATKDLVDSLNVLASIPNTTTAGDELVLKFTVIDPNSGEVTQHYELDKASNLPYSNASSGLTATDVQGAIDELNTGLSSSTLAGLGDTSISSPANNDVLTYDGTNWINSSVIWSSISQNATSIGDLTTLTTDDKSDLVNAINEVDANTDTNTTNLNNEATRATGVEGDLTTLTTDDKSDLVNAINEVDANTDTNTTNISSLQGYILGSGTTASRPSTTLSGAQYFDTDLVKPIWWDNAGSQWVDATGTAV